MRTFLLAATALLATPFLVAANANATLISLGAQQAGVNGGAIQTVATDGGSGALAANGSFGTFTLNLVTATGAPLLPQPSFDTNSINVSSATGGVLTIYITEQGLTTPLGVNNFMSSFTANLLNGAVTSVAEKTLISASNALYDGTLLASATFNAIGTYTSVNTTPVLTGPYSETAVYTITTTGSANVNDTIDITAVPEPASLGLLGAGLFGLGMIRRRAPRAVA